MREFLYKYKRFPKFALKCTRLKRKGIILLHRGYSAQQKEKYISRKYRQIQGYEMDWRNPSSYTQKIQYAKLYNTNKLKTLCSDKVAVRDYVAQTVGEQYLIPIYGVWEQFDDIDFSQLPNEFVMKTNHGSATNVIVTDKRKLDVKKLRKTMTDYLHDDFAYYGFESHYAGIRPVIYAEQLLHFDESGLEDYKFLCFDGEPHYFWLDYNRHTNHKRNMYDISWNLMPWNQWHYGNYDGEVVIPDNFNEMFDVVTKLSAGFDHVRVDLYNVHGKIYFGELTFTNGSGYEPIVPREMDYQLGLLWQLPKKHE